MTQDPGQPYASPAYPPPFVPQSSGKATTSLVLGILSLVMCGFLIGIPAMVLGHQAKREIRESQGRLGGEGMATAGFWTGLVGSVWSALLAVFIVGIFIFGGAVSSSFETTCQSVDGSGTTTDCSSP